MKRALRCVSLCRCSSPCNSTEQTSTWTSTYLTRISLSTRLKRDPLFGTAMCIQWPLSQRTLSASPTLAMCTVGIISTRTKGAFNAPQLNLALIWSSFCWLSSLVASTRPLYVKHAQKKNNSRWLSWTLLINLQWLSPPLIRILRYTLLFLRACGKQAAMLKPLMVKDNWNVTVR
jgi:hypothetical protein